MSHIDLINRTVKMVKWLNIKDWLSFNTFRSPTSDADVPIQTVESNLFGYLFTERDRELIILIIRPSNDVKCVWKSAIVDNSSSKQGVWSWHCVCDDRGDALFWSDSLRSVKADAAGRKPDWRFITCCLLSTIVSWWEMAIDLHTVCVPWHTHTFQGFMPRDWKRICVQYRRCLN